MGLIELLLLAVGLSMDAFAVSVCKGLAIKKIQVKSCLICGIWFGGFQALMPLIGYILGAQFAGYVSNITPWIAFILLLAIGGNMIKEALSKGEECADGTLDIKSMFLLAIATSIDALAVGVTFACVPVAVLNASEWLNTLLGVCMIGIVTFLLSAAGVKIGNVFGTKYEKKAEFTGGIILIAIGSKILLEYLL